MSTAVEVFPVSLSQKIPYQDYRSINNPIDIANVYYYANDIEDITEKVEDLKDPLNLGVFQLATKVNLGQGLGQGLQLFHYAIGPLEIKLSLDGDKIALQVFLNIPLLPAIQVLDISGSLSEGIEGTLGYPGMLSGTISVKRAGGKTILGYSATVIGKTFSGSIPLPF